MLSEEKKSLLVTLSKVGDAFRLEGKVYSFDILNNGHINKTIKVTYRREDKTLKAYLFQRVNTYVFRDPKGIMDNIDKVTSHIINKEGRTGTALHFHHTLDGTNYYFTEDGEFWRVMNFIESVTFNKCDDISVIEGVGKAFGQFQRQLSDFDGSMLHETIPDFHDTRKRLDTFFGHFESMESDRKQEITEEAKYLASVKELACSVWDKFAAKEIPVRVSHNDTKANNVLFDRNTKEPIVVIDLDTVMPGMAIYDFGDAVRFIASTAVEDEPDTSLVAIDKTKFEALARGFIREVKGTLTSVEISNLVLASFSITIELASRFIDDYLCGDKYFSIDYPNHNLVRARCQLALAKNMYENMEELQTIIDKICNE